ncbi:MAG: NAD(P)/FAD-dependent oxidoreductase [Bacteroidota bacterium]|nr:NAD(P)/FAD-dependent oxidoreductase [Sphingobacteriales bacterium]
MKRKVVVAGGGAAGFFAAITCAQANKDAEVIILEKTNKLLSKVAVSGGGRCNVTHACFDLKQLSLSYPRGEKQLKSAFSRFMTTDTVKWFEERGVKLKTEEDGRMFPTTDNSETIIKCLLKEAKKLKIEIKEQTEVKQITPRFQGGFELKLGSGEKMECDKLIVACGGSPKIEGLNWIKELGHEIIEPVPSLFTFNIQDEELANLQGISVNPAKAKILDTKMEFSGPVLITHWGLSGPAILKLSSYGARILAEKDYDFQVQINWMNEKKEEVARLELMNLKAANPSKQINVLFPFILPKRLLHYLFEKTGINDKMKWGEISKEDVNRFVNNLLYDTYHVKGKTPFKEEFVTCGGIGLDDIDFKTMQSKRCKDIHFAGEILDIDGITGGFNFQAAWTTGYLAGLGAAK